MNTASTRRCSSALCGSPGTSSTRETCSTTGCADGVVHDFVGSPTASASASRAAHDFDDDLDANLVTEEMDLTHEWFGDDFAVTEHQATCTVVGAAIAQLTI